MQNVYESLVCISYTSTGQGAHREQWCLFSLHWENKGWSAYNSAVESSTSLFNSVSEDHTRMIAELKKDAQGDGP